MKLLVAVFAFNEGPKLLSTLSRFPTERDYDLVVMDDGSTDGSTEGIKEKYRLEVVRHASNRGIGASMKTIYEYALSNRYEILAIVAGNDKDRPDEIPRLVEPIVRRGFDFVQGSRFMKGGNYGNTPFYRIIATKIIHPLLLSLVSGKLVTESTNGFRAFRVSILGDERINWRQGWLDKYELEPYLLYKVIKLGYKHTEVPVTKIYPPKELGYTKMRPISGWWSILRPLVYLALKIKT